MQHMSSLKSYFGYNPNWPCSQVIICHSSELLDSKGIFFSYLVQTAAHMSFKILCPTQLFAKKNRQSSGHQPASHKNDTDPTITLINEAILLKWSFWASLEYYRLQGKYRPIAQTYLSLPLIYNDEVEEQGGLQGWWHHSVLCEGLWCQHYRVFTITDIYSTERKHNAQKKMLNHISIISSLVFIKTNKFCRAEESPGQNMGSLQLCLPKDLIHHVPQSRADTLPCLLLWTDHSWEEEMCQVQGQDNNQLQEVQYASTVLSRKCFIIGRSPSPAHSTAKVSIAPFVFFCFVF